MANLKTGLKGVMNGANTYEIGDIGQDGGTFLIDVNKSGFTGTGAILKAKGRDQATYKAIQYAAYHINGASADPTAFISTPITDESLIIVVVADGMSLMFDLSGGGAWASNALNYQAYPSGAGAK